MSPYAKTIEYWDRQLKRMESATKCILTVDELRQLVQVVKVLDEENSKLKHIVTTINTRTFIPR